MRSSSLVFLVGAASGRPGVITEGSIAAGLNHAIKNKVGKRDRHLREGIPLYSPVKFGFRFAANADTASW
jgi:hypothetical protein